MIRIRQEEEEEARRRRRGGITSNNNETTPLQSGIKTVALAVLAGIGLGIGFYIVQKKMGMS